MAFPNIFLPAKENLPKFPKRCVAVILLMKHQMMDKFQKFYAHQPVHRESIFKNVPTR
jgi:hypothetical protein